jgi:hypothetical protein
MYLDRCEVLSRRNHYIKMTMRQESYTHCLYRTNRGEMRVGGTRLWAFSFYVHPHLAAPTAQKEEVCCYRDSHYRTRCVIQPHCVFTELCVNWTR